MTSRAGLTTRRNDVDSPSGEARRHSARLAPRAFTLLELILSLSLLMLLAGAAIGTFWGTLSATKTQANADRICSLLRATRAEAANTGRRFQISFDAETRQPVVAIEEDPLGEPGVFSPCKAWWAEGVELMEGVRVVLCHRTGDSAFTDAGQPTRAPGKGDDSLSSLTFWPDGSSDSARIVLANDDEDHPWVVEITLNGVDGTIATRQIDTEEEPIE